MKNFIYVVFRQNISKPMTPAVYIGAYTTEALAEEKAASLNDFSSARQLAGSTKDHMRFFVDTMRLHSR